MATKTFPVTNKKWVDLGATPCFLQNLTIYPVRFVIDTAAPGDLAQGGHVLGTGAAGWANISLADQKVFALADQDAGALVAVSR